MSKPKENKIQKAVFNSLDNFLKACKTTAKSVNKKADYIQADLLRLIINQSYWKLTTNLIANDFINDYNIMIDKLGASLTLTAASKETDKIYFHEILKAINIIKSSYKKGLDETV